MLAFPIPTSHEEQPGDVWMPHPSTRLPLTPSAHAVNLKGLRGAAGVLLSPQYTLGLSTKPLNIFHLQPPGLKREGGVGSHHSLSAIGGEGIPVGLASNSPWQLLGV